MMDLFSFPLGVAMASLPSDAYWPISRVFVADVGRDVVAVVGCALDAVFGRIRDGRSAMASCASDDRAFMVVDGGLKDEEDEGRLRRPVEVAGRSEVPNRDAEPRRERVGVPMTASSSSCG
jgi:hypothetical protein